MSRYDDFYFVLEICEINNINYGHRENRPPNRFLILNNNYLK